MRKRYADWRLPAHKDTFELCGLHAMFQGLRLVTSCEAAFPSLLQTEVLPLLLVAKLCSIVCIACENGLDLDVVHGLPVCVAASQFAVRPSSSNSLARCDLIPDRVLGSAIDSPAELTDPAW